MSRFIAKRGREPVLWFDRSRLDVKSALDQIDVSNGNSTFVLRFRLRVRFNFSSAVASRCSQSWKPIDELCSVFCYEVAFERF